MALAVTTNLDRYRYVATLGSGGMATVSLAEDTVLGRPVALKRTFGAADVRGISRLRREALVGASVSHPNLVSIYDVLTTEDGGHVIVMEYVPGETLRDRLQRQGRLPVPDALTVLDGVAAGLEAIHRRGIVHRDVKPPNILLSPDGAVKLADLGIASAPDRTRITSAGAVVGSFRYMAPEQLEDAPSTPAIDVYALAAVAFEILSGRTARPEANPVALAHAIATQPPPDLRDAWPQAPAAAAELLMRAMARDPARRPRSVTELVDGLRAQLVPAETAPTQARPVPARPVPAAPAVARSAPAVAAGAAAGGAVAGGAAAAAAVPGAAAAAQRVPARSPSSSPAGSPSPRRSPSPGRSPSPAAARSRPDPPRRRAGAGAGPGALLGADRPRRRLLVPALLATAAVVVALAVILSSGGSSSRLASGTQRSRSGAGSSAHRHAGSGSGSRHAASSPATAAGASTSAAGSSSPAGTSSTSGSGSAASTPAPPSSPAPATGSPVAAVESFYGAAAAHRYSQAWALADPTFQSQLGGYHSFVAGQSGDRSIRFDSARTVNQSGSSSTVAVTTTSVRTDGTQHCAGTVDLVSGASAGQWLLHLIHINCR